MRPLLLLLSSLLTPSAAMANPDGAPWDAAGAPNGRDCTSCHFDGEAERARPLIALKGLPAHFRSGRTYELTLSLAEAPPGVAAFVLKAQEKSGASAGAFKPADARTEANGAAIRSTAAGLARAPDKPEWRFSWTAPPRPASITFHVAANLANDDASPFGDRILLATFEVE